MSDEWDGKERRQHDIECEKKFDKFGGIVKDKICIAKKEILAKTAPTKTKVGIVLTIMLLMLSASLASAYKSISAAQDATEIHTRNTSNITHNKEDIEDVKKDHAVLVRKVETMEERQILMYGDVKKILGIIEEME